MVKNKQQVIELIQINMQDIEKFGAERIGIFGSFARNEQNEESDVDLIVEFKLGMKKYRNYLNLADFLEAKLERKVDLLTWESMASFVQREVRKEIEYISIVN